MRLGARGARLVLLTAIASGCGYFRDSGTTAVNVNVNRLIAQQDPPAAASPELPKPPGAQPPTTVRVAGLPASTLSDPSRANQGSVAASIERQQQRARQQLEKRLRAVYADQVRQFELAVQRELAGGRPAGFETANRRIRERFERYADQRAPVAARLYDIVGFPDPNPNNEPPKQELGAVSRRLYEEAAEKRRELAAIEADYQRDKAAILKEAEDALSEKEAAALTRVRELADRLERQAVDEANAAVRTSVRDLGLQLTDPQPLALPATPDRTVTLPAAPAFPPPPKVPSGQIPSGRADQRQRMERELKIWLGVNRYRLDPKARDATAEFQRWRESHRAGL